MEIELTIAIPTYNRRVLLDRLLLNLKEELTKEVEVLVSDNASTDGTETMIKDNYSFVRYYCNEYNLGSDRNFLECYRKSHGRYVWLVGSDDIITKGSISKILNFIKTNRDFKLPVIFLNHNSFQGNYKGDSCCKASFLGNDCKDCIVHSKYEFMEYAGKQLTFMSSFLLKRDAFNKIVNPEKYFGTYFIHTYFAFEATKKEDIAYGIIGYPCVSQDLTPNNSELNEDYNKLFEVFGKWTKAVLVDFASEIGYDQKQMNKIYRKGLLKKFASWIFHIKINNDNTGLKAFWKYCFPVINKYFYTWMVIVPIAIAPSIVSKLVHKVLEVKNGKKIN